MHTYVPYIAMVQVYGIKTTGYFLSRKPWNNETATSLTGRMRGCGGRGGGAGSKRSGGKGAALFIVACAHLCMYIPMVYLMLPLR